VSVVVLANPLNRVTTSGMIVSDIAVLLLKRDVKLQLTHSLVECGK